MSGLDVMSRKSVQISVHTATFSKGPGNKGLGFSVVGGRDSPRGERSEALAFKQFY